MGEYGIAKLRGDEEEQKRALRDINTQRTYSAFGKEVKPVSGFKEAVGTGIELGPYVTGGGVVKTAIKAPGILRGVGEGAKFGFEGGALMGAGEEMQREGSTLGSTLREATEFALTGGLFGGAGGGIIGGISKKIAKRKELQKLIKKEIDLIKKGTPEASVATKEIG